MRYSLVVVALLCSDPAQCADAEPKPKIISLLTLVNEQNEIENQAAPLNGKIESMSWQQVRMEGLSSDSKEVVVSSRLKKYDGDNRVIEEEVNRQIALDRSTNTYQNGLLMSTRGRTVNKDGKQIGDEFWQTYEYDSAGQLLDLKRGRGEKLQNHFVSKYDASGHLIRREIRQGVNDALVYTEEFQYNGRPPTVERRTMTPEGGTKFPTKYRLDADGNVVELWSYQGYHVSWKYDGQNRVIEQLTDAYAVPSACDDCPLPGAIRTRYEERSREQTFFEPGGKAVLQRVTTMERDGSFATIKYHELDHAERPDAPDLYRVVGAIVPRGGERYVSTVWDDHGNWTEKKQYFKPLTGPAIVQFIYCRRFIYR